MNPDTFKIVILVLALGGGVAAVKFGLFKPTLPAFVPRGPGQAGELAPPLLLGAFAAYSVSAMLGWVASLLSGLAAHRSPPEPRLEMLAHTAVLTMLLAMPAVVYIAWWARQIVQQPFDPSPRRLPKLVGEGLLWSLAVVPMVMAIGLLAAWVSRQLGQPVDETSHLLLKRIAGPTDEPAWWRWCLVASAVIGAPVVEEVCFRALLQRGLMTMTRSVWPGVIFTSVVFTAVHVGSVPAGSFWAAAAMLFPLSVMLGLLFARTGSVVTTIVVHAVFNGVNIGLALSRAA